mmetsp:Transcript_27766/g.86466  ORF Transcript_27766/g.86466 Transcript_27766/m.86466 type:complete len:228 (+) Transcript_27766:361-1044(+)
MAVRVHASARELVEFRKEDAAHGESHERPQLASTGCEAVQDIAGRGLRESRLPLKLRIDVEAGFSVPEGCRVWRLCRCSPSSLQLPAHDFHVLHGTLGRPLVLHGLGPDRWLLRGTPSSPGSWKHSRHGRQQAGKAKTEGLSLWTGHLSSDPDDLVGRAPMARLVLRCCCQHCGPVACKGRAHAATTKQHKQRGGHQEHPCRRHPHLWRHGRARHLGSSRADQAEIA